MKAGPCSAWSYGHIGATATSTGVPFTLRVRAKRDNVATARTASIDAKATLGVSFHSGDACHREGSPRIREWVVKGYRT